MPSESMHVEQAVHNLHVMQHLLSQGEEFSDWAATVAFYAALHMVEALFAKTHPAKHGRNHVAREQLLKRETAYRAIARHYRSLWVVSTVARYLSESEGADVGQRFTTYLPFGQLKSEIVNHHLHQIRKQVSHQLSPDQKDRLNAASVAVQ